MGGEGEKALASGGAQVQRLFISGRDLPDYRNETDEVSLMALRNVVSARLSSISHREFDIIGAYCMIQHPVAIANNSLLY
jgi:hypothetical protein